MRHRRQRDRRSVRLACLAAAMAAAFVLPFAAFAQEYDDEDAELAEMDDMPGSEALPEFNLGDQDNGWYFTREGGLCRMYSFNDPLVIQADASDPLRTRFVFQMIDREIAQPQGAEVPMIVAMRGKADAEFEGFNAVAMASHDMRNYGYLMPVPLGELVARFPNGFQLILMDKDQNRVMASDTLGSAKHLAMLDACAKGS